MTIQNHCIISKYFWHLVHFFLPRIAFSKQWMHFIRLFFYLSIWRFSPQSRIFQSYGYVTITGEGIQILTNTRHSWPLNIEHWGLISVPQLLWHEASVYNGTLRGTSILTPVVERLWLAMELSLPVFTNLVCRAWISNTQPSAC